MRSGETLAGQALGKTEMDARAPGEMGTGEMEMVGLEMVELETRETAWETKAPCGR